MTRERRRATSLANARCSMQCSGVRTIPAAARGAGSGLGQLGSLLRPQTAIPLCTLDPVGAYHQSPGMAAAITLGRAVRRTAVLLAVVSALTGCSVPIAVAPGSTSAFCRPGMAPGVVLKYLRTLTSELTPPPGYLKSPGESERNSITYTAVSRDASGRTVVRVDINDNPVYRIELSRNGTTENAESLDGRMDKAPLESLRTLLAPTQSEEWRAFQKLRKPGDSVPLELSVFGVSMRGSVSFVEVVDVNGRIAARVTARFAQSRAQDTVSVAGYAFAWRNAQMETDTLCDDVSGSILKQRQRSVVDVTVLQPATAGPYTASGRQTREEEIVLDLASSTLRPDGAQRK